MAAGAGLAASPAGTLDFEPCQIRGSNGQGEAAAECARLTVAEDPGDPDGTQIELFIARVPALSPEPAADAITLINGGPGGSSVALYVDLQSAFAALRRERDIVMVDQRGTGRSKALNCPDLEEATYEFDLEAVRRATRQCLSALDGDPRFYTTSVAVADLEAVRQALGYQAWNLYGVSYGTRVAQHYLQRYPDAVRTLIIDGVIPPGLALGPDIAGNAQAVLDAIISRCADTDYCRDAFPDLQARLSELGERLRAEPVAMTLPHPVSGREQAMSVHYAHLAMTLRLLSYAPETAAVIPLIIDEAAERRNYVPLASQALRLEEQLGEAISYGMHNSVVCTEDVPFFGDLSPRLPAMEDTYLGADQVRALQAICELWPRGTLHEALRREQAADHPVLLLSGEFDPITPPDYAELAARLYPNGRHFVAPGQGHGVIARGCVPHLAREFIDHADAGNLDGDCLERLAGDAFFVDLLGPPP
ncbi:MAG: alpha/beta hydrolase [Gammaproteobacteria bacterium]|nr:alpha/beta hydrolase [Gammaproteobacteria bacterium]